ncbi:MAG: hypothetical protein K8L91_07255 [Anaerolineae bacterium]|nr:hypothetical protein [Anaerolineae bacterium]
MVNKFWLYRLTFVVIAVIIGANTILGKAIPVSSQDSEPTIYRDLAWSPDGTQIAFTFGSDYTDSDIGVVNVSTGIITNLTPEMSGRQDWPIWSPDSQHLAFVSTTFESADLSQVASETWIMNRDGTEAKVLGETQSVKLVTVGFSPSDDTILVMNEVVDYRTRVYRPAVLALDIQNVHHQRFELPTSGDLTVLALSPDGSQLAFVTTTGSDDSIWVVDYTGPTFKNAEAVYASKHWISYLGWSPDGNFLIFGETDADYSIGVFKIIDIDTGEPTLLSLHLPSEARFPKYAPDGSRIVFSMGDPSDPNLWRIWSMDSDGTELTNVTTEVDGNIHTDVIWSPDSTSIAFVVTTTTEDYQIQSSEIWLIEADGSSPINLTPR